MSRYPNETVARFDQQFVETPAERNTRLRENRDRRLVETLYRLIADLSGALTDEGADWSNDGLHEMRRRVANALPPPQCPDWLHQYRDAQVIKS